MKLVIASGNPGQAARVPRRCWSRSASRSCRSRELGIPDAEEPHATFVENALAKARHASRLAGMPAFADDSGICVAALGGEPGVHSARYAGGAATAAREAQDERNNRKLLAELAGEADRRAHYYCVIVLVRQADDPEPLIAEGRWHGEVIDDARGIERLRLRPVFLPAGARPHRRRARRRDEERA